MAELDCVHLQLGNPMSRTDLRDAILGSDIQTDSNVVMTAVPKTLEESNEKLPLSIVVIGDKGWLVGGLSHNFRAVLLSFQDAVSMTCTPQCAIVPLATIAHHEFWW